MSAARRAGRPSSSAVWQAGFLAGAALGAAATVLGRRAEAEARTGLVDWRAVERLAEGRLRNAAGHLPPAEVAASGPAYEAAMRRVVPALEVALDTSLPGDRGAGCRRRSSRLGPGQPLDVRGALRSPGRRAPRPDRAARRRARQGLARPREPLDHDPPVRAAARLHGPAGPGPVRPRAPLSGGRAGAAALRRGEHPPDRANARRAAGPVPHLDCPPRDDSRLRVRGPPVAAPVPGRPPRATAVGARAQHLRARPGRVARARAGPARWGRALARAAHVGRAAPPLPGDADRDEPPRGLLRPRHGRGRTRPGSWRRDDQRPLPRPPSEADAHGAGDPADHGSRPEDGAVRPRRAVRGGGGARRRPGRPAPSLGRPRDAASRRRAGAAGAVGPPGHRHAERGTRAGLVRSAGATG